MERNSSERNMRKGKKIKMWLPVRPEISSLSYVVMLFIWCCQVRQGLLDRAVMLSLAQDFWKIRFALIGERLQKCGPWRRWGMWKRGCGWCDRAVCVSLYTLLELMSLGLVQSSLGEVTQHSGWMTSYPEPLEKETTLLKRPFFKFIFLLLLTIA